MLKALRRWWRYLAARLGFALEEVADPKVQLEQAIAESREQHRRLTEQAATVIANQTQLERQLDRAIDDYGRANASARQALLLADKAASGGDAEKSASYNQAAEAFASRVIQLEGQAKDLRAGLLNAAQASAQARQAVSLNAAQLQKALGERERLLSQLDQAKMQEQMNAAMAQLRQSVGDDVPTFDEMRTKIERRLAAAQATTELTGTSVDVQMLEVEKAQADAEAHARLAGMRTELGLPAGSPEVVVIKPERQAIEAGGDTTS
jgi:phage shock protein A